MKKKKKPLFQWNSKIIWKTNKWTDSCNGCDRDIVDSYDNVDWVQLNQPGGGS